MASIWNRLRGSKPEERMSVDQWAHQWMNYNGLQYPMASSRQRGSYNAEVIDNDFAGYVNGAYKSNGIVFACQMARMLIFSEMRFQYQKMEEGRPGDLFDDPDLDILRKPWPNGTTGELLERAIQDTDFAGNHYIVREGNRLRRLRPDWVDIILTAPPDRAVASDVAGYLYRPGGTDDRDLWELYPIDGSKGQIAHWSPIPDPLAQYRGMSWLTPVLREIMTDTSASKHKQRYFENAATPALAVALDASVTPEQFAEFMEKMDAAHNGVENAGKTLYLGGGADVTVIGAHMQQVDFKQIQGAIETRIAAAARVHPAIVGLSEGLQGSSLNEGNFKAAKEQFGSGTMRPLWRSLCAAYDVLVDDFVGARLWYDDRDVAFLRQDRKDEADLKAREAETIAKLVMQGYTSESVVKAVIEGDWRLLEHSGLYSVQLWPPESDMGQGGAAAASKSNSNQSDPGDNGKSPNDSDDKKSDNSKAGKEKKQ